MPEVGGRRSERVSIQGLIFDFGGVLLDMRWDAAALLEREHNLREMLIAESLYGESGPWREISRGRGDREAWLAEAHTALEQDAGRPLPPLHQHWREQMQLILPNITLIRDLRTRYRTAVLSNADSTLRDRLQDTYAIDDLFDDIVCSADVGMAKPEPGIYALAARRLGLPPEECVFIDDVERNLVPAREAGMQAVHFRIDRGDSLAAQLAELGVR